MKIKILTGFCLRAREDVRPGDIVEATKYEAALPISLGWAVPFDGDAEADDAVQPQPSLAANTGRRGARK